MRTSDGSGDPVGDVLKRNLASSGTPPALVSYSHSPRPRTPPPTPDAASTFVQPTGEPTYARTCPSARGPITTSPSSGRLTRSSLQILPPWYLRIVDPPIGEPMFTSSSWLRSPPKIRKPESAQMSTHSRLCTWVSAGWGEPPNTTRGSNTTTSEARIRFLRSSLWLMSLGDSCARL